MIQRSQSALLAVFPTVQSWIEFSEHSENAKALESILDFAVREKLINSPKATQLIPLIESFETLDGEDELRERITNMEELFHKEGPLLNSKLSVRAMTDRINRLIASCKIDLPNVTNSMLTRLKKEPLDTLHKHNVLRSLSFWIGYHRPELSVSLNYSELLCLCSKSKQIANHKEGVRIGFSLCSRGDVINNDIVVWLKKEIKHYMDTSAEHILYGRWGRVKSHDLTTLYLDFPKQTDFTAPSAYRQCVRSALTLAHQISIRWALSPYFSPNRFLCIGICTGLFSMLDTYLFALLNAKLPSDPIIRLSAFSRQCLLINDIRAILCQTPYETHLFSGEAFPIWWVEGFWSNVYFDFIPDLLEDDLCLTPPSKAVSVFLKSPHNSLLGLEIAKTLYYRRRSWDAMDILQIILSIDSVQVNARNLRMMIFRNLALDAPSYDIAQGLFDQADKEGTFIREHCACHIEDFYCEYAVNKLAHALTITRHLRAHHGFPDDPDKLTRMKQKVFSLLDTSEDIFKTGVTVSPSGIRSVYLLNSIMVLKAVLNGDHDLFKDPAKPLDGESSMVRQSSFNLQWQLGYIRGKKDMETPYHFLTTMVIDSFIMYNDSISLQAYRPTIYFCHAVVLWDFFPVRTVSNVKRILKHLNEAIRMARPLEKNGLCIYSFTRVYGEMIPASEFISHMEAIIRMISDVSGKSLLTKKDSDIVETDKSISSLIMTLNF